VTAAHVGGTVGDPFTFGGQTYVTDRVDRDPNGDLAVWHVTTAFPTWAPLYRSSNEVGRDAVLIGRGTQRGGVVSVLGSPRGWFWGTGDGVQRWGTNTVSAVRDGGQGAGQQLVAEFNLGASTTEAHLSVGDSGGGMFIQDSDNVWKLAGINVDVDGYYATDISGTLLNSIWGWPGLASLYDQSGFFSDGYTGVWAPVSGPGRLYATQISSRLAFIDSICPAPAGPQLMKVGEVLISSGGDSSIQYVEFEDPSAEALADGTFRLEVFDAAAQPLGNVGVDVPPQTTRFLVATSQAAAEFQVVADAELSVALPMDGQACIAETTGTKIHCLAWGCVDALVVPSAATGGWPTDGLSLQRQPAGAYQVAAPTPGAANVSGADSQACPEPSHFALTLVAMGVLLAQGIRGRPLLAFLEAPGVRRNLHVVDSSVTRP
jgi:hypothetical protein